MSLSITSSKSFSNLYLAGPLVALTVMSPIQKPTILIIHGLWHSPKHFRPLRNLFESHGFETECPTLPTFNAKAAPPTISLAEDVSAVQVNFSFFK